MSVKLEYLNSNSNDKKEVEDDQIIEKRSIPQVPSVASHKIPDIAVLNQKSKIIDLNVVREHFKNGGRLSENQIRKILKDSSKILQKEGNVCYINKKCYIIGDIHGQYYDLLNIISAFDLNKDTILFLGDYVDRGSFSTEVYLYLMLLKIYYPSNVIILRGNHESLKMTTYFTFKAECIYKYSAEIYFEFVESFKNLPLVGVVQNSAYCCHGGISPFLNTLKDIDKINRFKEVEYDGLFCDILWSDPAEDYDNLKGKSWLFNDKRRCSYFYKYENVKEFLETNKLKTIIRGHEVQLEGYRVYKKINGEPSIVTIFSAPNYCEAYNNLGSILEYDERVVSLKRFSAVDHPFVLPGFLDGLNWSMPFVCEKVIEFAVELFKELDKNSLVKATEDLMLSVTILRNEREQIDELEKEESTVDCCILNTAESDEDFNDVAAKDAKNEEMKEQSSDSVLNLNLSPSQTPEIIEEIANLSIKDAVKIVEVQPKDRKETLVVNEQKKAELKKKSFKSKYFCI